MNRDFVEMLSAPSEAGAEFLIVGALALAAHGKPRATGDLDVWIRPSDDNAQKVLSALRRFGAPLLDLTLTDLTQPDTVFQIGFTESDRYPDGYFGRDLCQGLVPAAHAAHRRRGCTRHRPAGRHREQEGGGPPQR